MKLLLEIVRDELRKKESLVFLATLVVLLLALVKVVPVGQINTVVVYAATAAIILLVCYRLFSELLQPFRFIPSTKRTFDLAHRLIRDLSRDAGREVPVTVRATLLYSKVDQGEGRTRFATELYRLCQTGEVDLLHIISVENSEKLAFVKHNLAQLGDCPHYQMTVIPAIEERRGYIPYISLLIVGERCALMGLQTSVSEIGPALVFRRKDAIHALTAYFDHLMKWGIEVKDREKIYDTNVARLERMIGKEMSSHPDTVVLGGAETAER
jgi:hypothetical protein